MAVRMGEKRSMFHKMFEKEDQYALGQQEVDTMHGVLARQAVGQATNFGVGDYGIPWQGASGFRGHGVDPIQEAPIDEYHGHMIGSMALMNEVGKAYAGTSSVMNNATGRKWTYEDDRKLRELMERYGNRAWSNIAREFPSRSGKQCRERWINNLDPEIKRYPKRLLEHFMQSYRDTFKRHPNVEIVILSPNHMTSVLHEETTAWTKTELLLLVECHKKLGKKWSKIARRIPGRSENSIKNQWYAAERSLKAKRKNIKRDARPGIIEDYMRSLKEKGKNKVNEVTVPFPSSNFAASSQVPASGDNPLPPPPSMSAPFLGLGVGDGDGDHFPLEAMYEDPVFTDNHQPFAYPQESGYLSSPYALAPENPFAEDHHQEGGYYNQLQFHQLPTSVQQEQAFSNYRAAEDPNQVFAGRYFHEAGRDQVLAGLYYREAGPSHYDNDGGSGNPTGSPDIVANRLAMLAIADERPSLNPPPARGCF
ncbi:hypothetical protein C2845_PM01G35320 [Panicum miliaceum]|uniref:Transcription factor MYB98-like n=1 Tax=Panicum miliaceum TaxID=4540 RepID=A0A3L6THU6_PANMI|nr:hypothetical protein C2845_PM01G35320 [Panicum miliaceum]